ncbi:MAG: ABC transporter substrate-binding protein [SAR324 cluster bacterium]
MSKCLKLIRLARWVAMLLGAVLAWGAIFAWGTSAAAEDLRIGFVAPLSGGFAQAGRDMQNGFNLYVEEQQGRFAGAQVKVIYEDTQGSPPTAVTMAQKLIEQDKVQIILGGIPATEGYALAPVTTRGGVPYVVPVASADDLTQREKPKYPFLVRTGWSSSQTAHVLGQWACDQGIKRVSIVAADYAFGHESAGGFQKAFEDCGGKVVQKIWPPLGNKDFGPFLAQIKHDVDAVYTVLVANMPGQFAKQYQGAGLTPRLLGQGMSADEFVLPSMGDEALGYVTALQYSAALETPKNEAFVKKYRAKFGKVPSFYSESSYTSGQWIHEAMKKAGGKWPGSQEFVRLMAGTQLDAVRGPVRFDDTMNPVQNVYIRKVERKKMFGYPDAELWNTVIKTVPGVSQFWTYGKEKFLQQPVYSRDFPPCRYCE